MMERRTLLKGSLAAVALAGVKPGWLFGDSPALGEGTAYSLARFEALRGSRLKIDAGGTWRGARLVEVRPHDVAPELEQFSLEIRSDAAVEMPEGIYTVDLGRGTPIELCLSPSGSENGSSSFTASFSLLRPIAAS